MTTATQDPRPRKWEPDKTIRRLVETYGHLLNIPGGHEPLDLLALIHTDENLLAESVVVFTLAHEVDAQVQLLRRLEERDLLVSEVAPTESAADNERDALGYLDDGQIPEHHRTRRKRVQHEPTDDKREALARILFIASDSRRTDELAKAWDAPGPHGRQRWYDYADAVLTAGSPAFKEGTQP